MESRKGLFVLLSALLLPVFPIVAQDLPPGQPPGAPDDQQYSQQPQQVFSPQQLDNLVAPVALYPDPLLSQVLAASTYPLEIVEAQQWLQNNSGLQGAQRIEAAKQQNWDASVQALVAFPDALRLLSSNVRWTTDLGNAFLAQQADVMSAVQRMRARARSDGRLNSTPQQVVTTESQDGQSAIEIQPADPQVIYVPVYSPQYVWGPPVWGAYPSLWYPPGYAFGFGFGPGIFIDAFFPGWYGWGGWGWGCGWFGRGLFVNAGFFNRFGFHGGFREGFGRGFGGRAAWSHDPGHRLGVPYPNRTVAGRFGSNRFAGGGMSRGQFGGSRGNAGAFNGGRSNNFSNNAGRSGTGAWGGANGFRGNGSTAGGWQRFQGGNNRPAQFGSPGSYRQGTQGFGNRNPAQSNRGSGSTPSYNRPFSPAYSAPRGGNFSAPHSFAAPRQTFSAPRSFSAPRQNFSAPRSYSAPHYSGGGFSGHSSFSGGQSGFSGGGHSGFSGGHSGSSGGHGGGGGGHRR